MEQNATTTTPVMDSGKQKDEKGWKITTAIVSVIAVCGIGFGIYGITQSFQKDSQISDLKSEIKVITRDPEISLDILSELDDLTQIILLQTGYSYGRNMLGSTMGFSIDLLYTGSLSNEQKTSIAINEQWPIEQQQRPSYKRRITEDEARLIASTTDLTVEKLTANGGIMVLDEKYVAETYQNIFGEEIIHSDSLICGSALYSAAAKVYYAPVSVGGCGGIYTGIHFYKYNYEVDDDKAYVYIASATEDATAKYYCKSIQRIKNIQGNTDKCFEVPKNTNFLLNGTNYQDFPKHRLIFNKNNDSGKYYFEKAEPVSS